MDITQEIFGRRRPVYDKLKQSGFMPEGDALVYREPFMDASLIAQITVSMLPGQTGQVHCQAIDAETGEEYALINVASSSGSFVGTARAEYRNLLERIARVCFSDVPFYSDQANRIAGLIEAAYQVLPENPFSAVEHAGVFREPVTGKWFGLIMQVERNKLDPLSGKEKLEIINLKIDPEHLPTLLKEPGIYPCYHMNKKMWISAALDDTLSDSRLMELIRDSYTLIRPGRYWIIPSNPALFDVAAGFQAGGDILTWHHRIRVAVGDIVYIYQTEPVASLMWKCEVIGCSTETTDRSGKATHLMYLKRIESYRQGQYPRAWLNEHGVKKTVRGQRSAPKELVKALEQDI